MTDKLPSPFSWGLLYSKEPLAEGKGLIIQTASSNQSPSAKTDPLLLAYSSLHVYPQGNEFGGTLFFFPNPITQSGGVKGLMPHDKGQPSLGREEKGKHCAHSQQLPETKTPLEKCKVMALLRKKAREPCLNPRALSLPGLYRSQKPSPLSH